MAADPGLWLYVIVTTAVWYLPVAGWLLLVSAWAKRAVILWSILPPLRALSSSSAYFRHAHVIGHVIDAARYRVPGSHTRSQYTGCDDGGDRRYRRITRRPIVWHFINPRGFFASPETWIGVGGGSRVDRRARSNCGCGARRSDLMRGAARPRPRRPRCRRRAALWLIASGARCAPRNFFRYAIKIHCIRGFYLPLPSDGRLSEGADAVGDPARSAIRSMWRTGRTRACSSTVRAQRSTSPIETRCTQHWRYRITVPIIHDSGGFLDSAIDHWHRWFGFNPGQSAVLPAESTRLSPIPATRASISTSRKPASATSPAELGWYAVDDAHRTLSLSGRD